MGGAWKRIVAGRYFLGLVAAAAVVAGPLVLPAAAAPAAAAASASVLGSYNVAYGNQAIVKVTGSGGQYSIISETPILLGNNGVPASSCYLPQGTLLGSFSGTGPSYPGQHGLWYTSDCSFGQWDPGMFTLSGGTLTFTPTSSSSQIVFTKVTGPPTPTLRSVGLLTFRTYDHGTPVVRGCTATVVDSPSRSTILTAAHCLISPAAFGGGGTGVVTDLQFAPAHTGECWDNINAASPNQVEVSQCGTNPYGVWYANSSDVYISKNYSAKTGTDDYAFVVLAPDPAYGPVESLVGGFPITVDPNGGGPSDPEQAQTWQVSSYAADDINFTKTYGFGPFGCDASPSSHITPNLGQFGELVGACSFIDPISGQETGFQMPASGLPFGSSGSPWTNNLNSGTGAYTIGADQFGGGQICTSGPGCAAVFGTVLGPDAQTVLTKAGSAPTPIRQLYSCSPGGNQDVTVSAQASENETTEQLTLSKITYTVTNPTTSAATVTGATFYVPDPDAVNAPYITGSATIATSPGWSAGHDTNGTFASFSGSLAVGPGATVSTPAFSASYSEAGPAATVITWHPGPATITISSPTSQTITCTPTAPLGNLARTKE